MRQVCPTRGAASLLLACCLGGLLLAGCGAPVRLRFNPAETHGKVYYLDGIGCYGFGRDEVPSGFIQAGYRGDVEYWNWSATGTPLDQLGGPFIRAKGAELAKLIQLYQQTYPGRPVSLIGLSGGTGVAVFACEYLPEGVCVDEVILVASSLSNSYNLTKALRHIRGGVTLYQTSGDLALGVGARLTGPIDGSPLATCAGITGFVPPGGLSGEERSLYSRVTNVAYSASFSALGFDGGHTSAVSSPAFVRYKFAPVVMTHACEPGTDGRPPGPVSSVSASRSGPSRGTSRPATHPERSRNDARSRVRLAMGT
ncbi:MAG: hypothetical protein PHU85_18705 [Phycisphaerae bacterium]|nr:hypothetical protein [Phycisphaerae bacterium]